MCEMCADMQGLGPIINVLGKDIPHLIGAANLGCLSKPMYILVASYTSCAAHAGFRNWSIPQKEKNEERFVAVVHG